MKSEWDGLLMKIFFSYAWKKRPKYCQVSGKLLPEELNTACMDHLLEKSQYPECKYAISNIFYVHPDVHSMKTNGFPHEKHKEAIDKALEKYDILIKESTIFEERILKKLEENELHNKKQLQE